MRIILLMMAISLFIPYARASSSPAPPATPGPFVITGNFEALKHTTSGRVDKIIDEKTILLKDARIVELLSLNYADRGDGDDTGQPLRAKELMEKLLPAGTEVMLWQSFNSRTGRVNRMGHMLAHMVRKSDGMWINGVLVAAGAARALPTASNAEMIGQLYALEAKARASGLGSWGKSSPARLLTADEAVALNPSGDVVVVEGRVNRAASSSNNLYLNFGSDWKIDFTVMVSPAIRRALAKAGIDPLALPGRDVRVRGWLRQWNGPFMELETADRLELLPVTAPALAAPPPAAPTGPMPEGARAGQVNP